MVFSVFQFVSITSCAVTDHHRQESGSAFFTPSIRYLHPLLRSPRVFARSISVSLCMMDASWPFTPLTPVCSHLLYQLWAQRSRCVSPEWRGRIPFLKLLATHCLMYPRRLVPFFPSRTLFWLMGNLIPARTHKPCSAKLLSSQLAPGWRLPLCESPCLDVTSTDAADPSSVQLRLKVMRLQVSEGTLPPCPSSP